MSSLQRSLAAHLRGAPEAADTLEGIVRWWLPPEHEGAPVAVVEAALDALVRAGCLVRRLLPDGTPLYQAASRSGRSTG